MVAVCSIDGCPKGAVRRGWCEGHYKRWRRYGDPTFYPPRKPPPIFTARPLRERFWKHVAVRGPGECWQWDKPHMFGYGVFRIEGKNLKAHRVAYELLIGPIPDGLTLDHECHNRDKSCEGGRTCPHRACVNPSHLRPVTMATNNKASHNYVGNRTECKYGHPFDESNTRWYRGHRVCIQCAKRKRDRMTQKGRAS